MTIRGPFATVLVVVAVISLAANFLVLGFVAARVGDFRQGAAERIVAFAVGGFPAELRRPIVARAREERERLRAALIDVQTARQAMFAAMRAEPFDAAAMERAFAEVRTKTSALQSLGQELVGGVVAEAPADLRARIKPRGWLP